MFSHYQYRNSSLTNTMSWGPVGEVASDVNDNVVKFLKYRLRKLENIGIHAPNLATALNADHLEDYHSFVTQTMADTINDTKILDINYVASNDFYIKERYAEQYDLARIRSYITFNLVQVNVDNLNEDLSRYMGHTGQSYEATCVFEAYRYLVYEPSDRSCEDVILEQAVHFRDLSSLGGMPTTTMSTNLVEMVKLGGNFSPESLTFRIPVMIGSHLDPITGMDDYQSGQASLDAGRSPSDPGARFIIRGNGRSLPFQPQKLFNLPVVGHSKKHGPFVSIISSAKSITSLIVKVKDSKVMLMSKVFSPYGQEENTFNILKIIVVLYKLFFEGRPFAPEKASKLIYHHVAPEHLVEVRRFLAPTALSVGPTSLNELANELFRGDTLSANIQRAQELIDAFIDNYLHKVKNEGIRQDIEMLLMLDSFSIYMHLQSIFDLPGSYINVESMKILENDILRLVGLMNTFGKRGPKTAMTTVIDSIRKVTMDRKSRFINNFSTRVRNNLFPHITFSERCGVVDENYPFAVLNLIAKMGAMCIETVLGFRTPDDTDEWNFKRLESVGRIFNREFYRGWRTWTKQLSDNIAKGGSSRISNDPEKYPVPTTEVITGELSSLFGSLRKDRKDAQSVADMIDVPTIQGLIDYSSKVRKKVHQQAGEQVRMRKLSALGYLCIYETPEGGNVGLVLSKAVTAFLSKQQDEIANILIKIVLNSQISSDVRRDAEIQNIRDRLSMQLGYNVSDVADGNFVTQSVVEARQLGWNSVCMINGIILGWCHGKFMYSALRRLRLGFFDRPVGENPYSQIGIVLSGINTTYDDTLEIHTGSERLMRPLYVVGNDHRLLAGGQDENLSFGEMLERGFVEFIDSREQTSRMVSVAARQGFGNVYEDYYSHVEYSPYAVFGPMASTFAAGNLMNGVRGAYAAGSHRKGGIGAYDPALSVSSSLFNILAQQPLVMTVMTRALDITPTGLNLRLNIKANRYNAEDSDRMADAVIGGGGMHRAELVQRKITIDNRTEEFNLPTMIERRPGLNYENLAEQDYIPRPNEPANKAQSIGIVKVGSFVSEGDVLAAKFVRDDKQQIQVGSGETRRIQQFRQFILTQVSPGKVGEKLDIEKFKKEGRIPSIAGEVINVISQTGVKVIEIMYTAPTENGDKITTVGSAQKTTAGHIPKDNELDFWYETVTNAETGEVTVIKVSPQAEVSPLALPTRKTGNMMLSSAAGLYCAMTGCMMDIPSFQDNTGIWDEMQDAMRAAKMIYDPNVVVGEVDLRDPITEDILPSRKAFIGVDYLQSVNQITRNKVRATGHGRVPVDHEYRTTEKGRQRGGGVRGGWMMSNAFMAANGAAILRGLHRESISAYTEFASPDENNEHAIVESRCEFGATHLQETITHQSTTDVDPTQIDGYATKFAFFNFQNTLNVMGMDLRPRPHDEKQPGMM